MNQDIIKKLDIDERIGILERLNPEFEGVVFDPVDTEILTQICSFYPDYRLLDIADHTSLPAKQRFVVYGADYFKILNFLNEPIYDLNLEVPILLNEETVFDYVRFFFTYVRGRHGRFIITESTENINWKEEPPPSARRVIGKMIEPLSFDRLDVEGNFYLKACLIFKDSLFKTQIKVEPNGFVSLSNEELLLEDMPILDDIFGQ